MLAVEQSRKLIITHQFNNEPFRILLASLASGLRPTDAFIASTLQKHILREAKTIDVATKNKELLRWNNLNKRYACTSTTSSQPDEDEDANGEGEGEEDVDDTVSQGPTNDKTKLPDTPSKDNPVVVAMYGQICIAARSYQSAICVSYFFRPYCKMNLWSVYLLRAFDYCPDDPVICLSLAIASIGRAMQRQADNRHHLVAQAIFYLVVAIIVIAHIIILVYGISFALSNPSPFPPRSHQRSGIQFWKSFPSIRYVTLFLLFLELRA